MKVECSSYGLASGLTIVEIDADAGRQCIAGGRMVVEAAIQAGSSTTLSAAIKIRPENSPRWTEVPMQFLTGNRWRGEFFITEPGNYVYVIEAWVDHFKAWRRSLQKELQAGSQFSRETLLAGVNLIEGMMGQAGALDAERLRGWAQELRTGNSAIGSPLKDRALDESLAKLMTELAGRQPERQSITTPEKELCIAAVTKNNL